MISPAYAAGLFDGEGCVHLRHQNLRPWKTDGTKHVSRFMLMITIANTNRDVLDVLQRCFGGYVTTTAMSRRQWKTVFRWVLTGAGDQRRFLTAMSPHLIVKRRQVEIALQYLDTIGILGAHISEDVRHRRMAMIDELRFLNFRGVRSGRRSRSGSVGRWPPGASP